MRADAEEPRPDEDPRAAELDESDPRLAIALVWTCSNCGSRASAGCRLWKRESSLDRTGGRDNEGGGGQDDEGGGPGGRDDKAGGPGRRDDEGGGPGGRDDEGGGPGGRDDEGGGPGGRDDAGAVGRDEAGDPMARPCLNRTQVSTGLSS